VNQTWGGVCDVLLFMTSQHYPGLNTVVLPIEDEESRNILWRKAILAWTYLYTHHGEEGDWFMRADDDVRCVRVVVE
jgi:glycoprotein-N-acetylgalactosamine 3-beta-galactosyltransferase